MKTSASGRWPVLLLGAVTLALSMNGCGSREGGEALQTVSLLGLHGRLPARWIFSRPDSSMRLAQYRVPGSPDAELVVYFFGPGQGGSVAQNATRWSAQFTDAEGAPVAPVISAVRDSAPRVSLVELHGNYARGAGMAADAAVLPDHSLLAAVVEAPGGNAYIQLWGPAATVAAARADYLSFLRGLAPEG